MRRVRPGERLRTKAKKKVESETRRAVKNKSEQEGEVRDQKRIYMKKSFT